MILDPAPARCADLSGELLQLTSCITPNESELATLTNARSSQA
ncbi:MAG: hypothetical protein WKF84_00235 [Pyrinomonadaceae bacterium]